MSNAFRYVLQAAHLQRMHSSVRLPACWIWLIKTAMHMIVSCLFFSATLYAQQITVGTGEGEIYLARGIVQYMQENYRTAEEEFLKGINVDPENIQILLMLGKTYGELKDYVSAIKFIEQAYEIDKMRTDVKKELARLYYSTGEYGKSKMLLDELLILNPDDFIPNYYMGLIFYEEKNFAASNDFFNRASSAGDNPEAYYYLGETYEKLGEKDRARESYTKVIESAKGTEIGVLATERQKALDKKNLNAGASAGLEYDSNVILLPEGMALPDEYSNASGSRFVLKGVAGLKPINRTGAEFSLDYNLYQNLYFSSGLSDFNTQNHNISAGFSKRDLKYKVLPYILNVTTSYSYTFLKPEFESYLGMLSVSPSITTLESKNLATVLNYQFNFMDFKLSPLIKEDDRDGIHNLINLKQVIASNSWSITPSIGFEANNAGINYDYRGYSAGFCFRGKFYSDFNGELFALAAYRDYFRHTFNRRDTELNSGIKISRIFGKYLTIELNVMQIVNNSINEYRYRRTIVGISATGSYK